MKRMYFIVVAIVVVCFAIFAGYNVYDNSTMTSQELLMKKNLEALARQEPGDKKELLFDTEEICYIYEPSLFGGHILVGQGTKYKCREDPNGMNCHDPACIQ